MWRKRVPTVPSDDVIAPGAKLEKVWGEGSFTEGGALDQDGSLLFSDIGNRIMRFDPKTGQTTVFREPSGRANGMIFDKLGQLIVAEGANSGGGRRVSITARDGTVRTLADNYDGKRFNSPNDVAVDSFGRVYVSDPRYVGNEPRELDFEGVFMIENQGFVTPLVTGALKPNGLALSPDEKTLYISDNGSRRRVLIAAHRAPNGRVGEPRVIHDFGSERRNRRHDRHDRRPHRRGRRLRGQGRRPGPLPRGKNPGDDPHPRRSRQRRVRRRPTARHSTSARAKACTGSRPRWSGTASGRASRLNSTCP